MHWNESKCDFLGWIKRLKEVNSTCKFKPQFETRRTEARFVVSTDCTVPRLRHSCTFFPCVTCTPIALCEHLTYIRNLFISNRRVSHTCDVPLAALEDVLGLHRKSVWQVWEDLLSFYKSQPNVLWQEGGLQSLSKPPRCDLFEHRQ